LLKAQELSEYTNDEQTLAQLSDVVLLPEEEQVLEAYSTRSQANQNIQACQAVDCDELANVTSERDEQAIEYQLAVEVLENTNLGQNSGIPGRDTNFSDKVQAIIATQPGTVVIYPLVLEDKLWLLWATENGFDTQQIEDFSREGLTQTVTNFRSSVENRYSSIEALQADAEQLYNWLIEPVEKSLGEEEALHHLVLSLDFSTRYLPIGALHDGEKYLIEKYDITTILSASLTNIQERSPVGTENVSLLAIGTSQGFENFKALPFVPIELDSIVKEQNNAADTVGVYPGQQLLDQSFTLESLQNSLLDKQFLHIATHGEFVSGSRYESYLLMGDGEKLLIPEISQLGSALKGIHLAVLSACQTGLGGADEEGLEVAGLGYYFFQNEVDAVTASLWNVSDSSTSQLMQRFYQNLSVGTVAEPVTKAEALQQAQLAMLRSNDLETDDNERFVLSPQNGDEVRPEIGLAHPYYWAPFILIGNGL
ncbi:MAG: CHAT domain-containing protein, partial [Cyanobacteria bacterium P01_A01_bin.17]